MYTLEDDQETSARLRQRDYHNSPYAAQADATVQAGNAAPATPDPAAPPTGRSGGVSGMLKKFFTPGQGATRADKRLAIAALFVACASVFVTSMDETVVVTALPKI